MAEVVKPGVSAHVDGARVWNERYGSALAAARHWRLAAMVALMLATVATGGLILIASQSQIVPYVVKVDRLGTSVAVDRADVAARPDRAIIVAQLSRWVTAVRSVYTDTTAQRALIGQAYVMINSRGEALVLLSHKAATSEAGPPSYHPSIYPDLPKPGEVSPAG